MADVTEGKLSRRSSARNKGEGVRVDVNVIRAKREEGEVIEFAESRRREDMASNFEKTAAEAARKLKERMEREGIERLLAEQGKDMKTSSALLGEGKESGKIKNGAEGGGAEGGTNNKSGESASVSGEEPAREPLAKALDASTLTRLYGDDSVQLTIWDFAGFFLLMASFSR